MVGEYRRASEAEISGWPEGASEFASDYEKKALELAELGPVARDDRMPAKKFAKSLGIKNEFSRWRKVDGFLSHVRCVEIETGQYYADVPVGSKTRRQVFLSVLEDTLSHRKALLASGYSWGEVQELFSDTSFTGRYEKLFGPIRDPKSFTYAMALAYDTLIQQAAFEGHPSSAINLLKSQDERFQARKVGRPRNEKKTTVGDLRKRGKDLYSKFMAEIN